MMRLETINVLPSIPWIFWDGWVSTHLQHRRTITPPKTRSSLARKGEPGRTKKTTLMRGLKIAWIWSKWQSNKPLVYFYFKDNTWQEEQRWSMRKKILPFKLFVFLPKLNNWKQLLCPDVFIVFSRRLNRNIKFHLYGHVLGRNMSMTDGVNLNSPRCKHSWKNKLYLRRGELEWGVVCMKTLGLSN